MLFEKLHREDEAPKHHTETVWQYLDRSARPEAERVRELLENWVSDYPTEDRDEIITRIRSDDDTNFKSATFELTLFALFRSLGCEIEVHPSLPNGSQKRPDFLIKTPQGANAYVEAVLTSEFSAAEVAAKKRTAVVLNALEKVDSPNFFVGFYSTGHPDRPPKAKLLRTTVEKWLSTLDPDSISHETEEIPKLSLEDGDWKIEFSAFPIKPERRGKGQRVLGAISHGARWANSWKPIRDAVASKGNRYGELPEPLVVACNFDSVGLERIDEMQSLFGREEFLIDPENVDAEPVMRRQPNGVWSGPNGPQYTRISGVWIFRNLSVWNLPTRLQRVYENPWAQRPLPELFFDFPNARSNGENMEWHGGVGLGDILKLQENWPEE